MVFSAVVLVFFSWYLVVCLPFSSIINVVPNFSLKAFTMFDRNSISGSCLLTFFLYNNGGDIRFVMYGLTTIGVGFTIKGMIDLLGW